ncbi:MAG TPA: hypothetical protein PLO40_12920 [Spirochaetota bacterium]|nr:hypothetical protein [Spirochaetota bacterium]HPK62482.1 hypothetical protein [Spirochaetota bacterium]HQF79097.1 hypothetical protein [Spirochaetota bacterium]HRU45539.1 hypothetical protein [Spirochaetota bacterium]
MTTQTMQNAIKEKKPLRRQNKRVKVVKYDKNNKLAPVIAEVSIEYKKIVTQLKEYLSEYLIGKMKTDMKQFLDKNYNLGIIFNLDKLTDGLDVIRDKYQDKFDLFQQDIIKVSNPEDYLEESITTLNSYDIDGKLEEYEQDDRLQNLVYQFQNFVRDRLLAYNNENPKLKITKKIAEQIQDSYTLDLLQNISVEDLSFNKKFEEIEALLNADDLKDNIKGVFKASLVMLNLKNEILDILDELGGIIRDEFIKLEEKLDEDGKRLGEYFKN